MRTLAILLLIWCSVLSAVPCCVFDGCADEECSTEQSAPHDKEHEDCGGCSPFFACAGCSGFVVTERIAVQNRAPLAEPALIVDGFRAEKERDYSASFWQPPRA